MRVPLIKVEDIPNEGAKAIDFFGREVLVYKVEGRPRAVMNTCMHLGGPLTLEGAHFVCAWHKAEFDCQGRRVSGPAAPQARLMFLPTRVEGDTLTYVYGEQ